MSGISAVHSDSTSEEKRALGRSERVVYVPPYGVLYTADRALSAGDVEERVCEPSCACRGPQVHADAHMAGVAQSVPLGPAEKRNSSGKAMRWVGGSPALSRQPTSKFTGASHIAKYGRRKQLRALLLVLLFHFLHPAALRRLPGRANPS